MTGATITVTNMTPGEGKKVIYFTVTLDGSAKASFAGYDGVDFIYACDVSTLATEPVTAYTAGGDITFTNAANVITGMAIVTQPHHKEVTNGKSRT